MFINKEILELVHAAQKTDILHLISTKVPEQKIIFFVVIIQT